MKKQKTIAITLMMLIALMIVPFVSAQAPTDKFSIAADDNSFVSDVILAIDVSATLDNAEDLFLFSEIDATEIVDDAVLAIYEGEAIIVLGEDASSELAAFIVDIGYYLDDLDVKHKIILSNEVTSSNLLDLFEDDTNFFMVPPCGNYGDVDNDGYVTEEDVNIIGDIAAGLTIELNSITKAEQMLRADVTGNGEVSGTDASKVSRYLNGYINTFPVCEDTNLTIYRVPPCGNYGDVDMDGYVTEADTNLTLKYAINLVVLSDEQIKRADVTANGEITSLDAAKMLRYSNYVINTFPVCGGKPCPCGNYGDVDDDGLVTQLDVDIIGKIAVGLIEITSSEQMLRADVTGNGEVTGTDASQVSRYLNGYIETFPVCGDTACTTEGDTTNPSLGPNYYIPCCSDLAMFYLGLTNEAGVSIVGSMVGSPSVCYDYEKGVPECDYEGTEKEGYYYPSGELLWLGECDGELNTPTPPVPFEEVEQGIGPSEEYEVKRIMAQEMTEIAMSSSNEIRSLYNYNGAQTRFLQFQKALIKAIAGQKQIISYIEENYPDADVTQLLEINSGLIQVYDEVKNVDIEFYSEHELAKLYVAYKEDAKELIALFKEEAHKILGGGDIIILRREVKNIDTAEMKTMSRNINQYKLKYNAEKVKETLIKVGIDDANLIEAVETGTINYGQIRSEIANKFKDLSYDIKKEAILEIREAKTKAEVKAQEIVQSMNLGNSSRIANQVKNRIAISNQNSNAKQGGK